MRVGRVQVPDGVALIAEIGNNHEGSVTVAREMIDAAAESGADAIKLQTLIPELFVSPKNTERLEQMRQFALSIDDTLQIISDYAERNVTVFSTPLDLISAAALSQSVSLFKVSSGDLTYTQLLEFCGESGHDVILSTGMAYLSEVAEAVSVLRNAWTEHGHHPGLGILHCVSAYPAHPRSANLAAIQGLRTAFPDAVIGYSDHTIGVDVAARSVAAGARIIEKHFTLDKAYSGFRDHQLSADPIDLQLLRSLINEIDAELGDGLKRPSDEELSGRTAFRRSVTVSASIKKGEVVSRDSLICQRPGDGIPPNELSLLVGKLASRDLEPGDVLLSGDVF